MEIENLKALVYSVKLNNYQKKLAMNEFEKLISAYEDAIEYISYIEDELNHKDSYIKS